MKPQLTAFELIRLILALLVATAVYFVATEVMLDFLIETVSVVEFFIDMLLVLFVPAFLTLLIGPILPSWRYKTIAATLMLIGITLWSLVDVFASLTGFMPFIVAVIRLSFSMAGALAGAYLWQFWKTKRAEKTEATPVTVAPATKIPKTSPLLLGLALVSIPATYVTIFASAFLVLGFSALLLLVLLELPRIPVFLIAAAVIAPIVAVWAGLRAIASIFLAEPPFQPAHVVDMAQRPCLNGIVDEVCAAVGTKRPDNVLLHAQPTFFVTQHKMNTFDGPIKGRTLAIGMPLVGQLTTGELKSVLAHEFAHFSGRDTYYSVWIAPVYQSLGEAIHRLQASGPGGQGAFHIAMYILKLPSLLFLMIFYEFFASVDAIISRARELRADWIAAIHYGGETFTSALKKVVQFGAHYNEHQDKLSQEQTNKFYKQYQMLACEDADKLQGYLDDAMNATEHEFDSHPTLATRIAHVPQTIVADQDADETLLMELSADEETLSGSYTALMKELRAYYGQLMMAE